MRSTSLILARGLGLAVLAGAIGLALTLMLLYPPHPYLNRPFNFWGQILFVLIYLSTAAFVFFKRTEQPAARALLISAAAALVTNTAGRIGVRPESLSDPFMRWLPELAHMVSAVISYTGLLHFAFMLPAPPRRFEGSIAKLIGFVISLYVLEFALLGLALLVSWQRAGGDVAQWVASWVRLWNAGYLLTLVATAIVASLRYRHDYSEAHRQQLRWFIFGGLIIVILNVLLTRLPVVIDGHDLLGVNGRGLLDALFPLLVGAVMLRYRVYDIEFVISRTLVYLTLTLGVAVAYAAIVVGIGQWFPSQSRLLQFVTVCVVALAFYPVRQRVQAGINRLMYGERDDPIRVLTRLGRRLESTLLPDQVLPAITETLGQALKLPCVCIALRDGDQWRIGATYAPKNGNVLTTQQLNQLLGEPEQRVELMHNLPVPVMKNGISQWPIVYQGQTIGQLIAFARSPQDNLTSADRQLLGALSRQVGSAAFAVQITQDLRRSREQILITREEERRRIGRDLHDGLGPTLAGVSLELGAVRNLIRTDPARVESLVNDLQTQLGSTINTVRQLVYELRPPVLDQLGLVAAIREQATRIQSSSAGHDAPTLQINLRAPDKLPALSAAVETAAYHIIREALNNVVKHAQAHTCLVTIDLCCPAPRSYQAADVGQTTAPVSHRLQIDVSDDGVGMTTHSLKKQIGIGLTSMRERASELGGVCEVEPSEAGGTRVHAVLPLD